MSAVQQSDPVIHTYTFFFSHYPPSCSIKSQYTDLQGKKKKQTYFKSDDKHKEQQKDKHEDV